VIKIEREEAQTNKQTNSKLSYTLHAWLCWVETGWATNVALLIFNFSTFSLSLHIVTLRQVKSVSFEENEVENLR